MPKTINVLFSLIFVLYCSLLSAQSIHEFVDLADDAYESDNHRAAIYFYKQVFLYGVDTAKVKEETIFKSIASPNNMNFNYYYEKGLEKSDYDRIIFQLANSYRMIYNYGNAEKWFKAAVNVSSYDYPLGRYWYALSLKKNGKYKKSLNQFLQFTYEFTEQESYYFKSAELEIKSCIFAFDEIIKSKSEIIVNRLPYNVNAIEADFASNFGDHDSSLIYASTRPECIPIDKKKHKKGIYATDLFRTEKHGNSWTTPENIGLPVNTSSNEGAVTLTYNKQTMYFTRWTGEKNNGEYAIYKSKKLNNAWSEPEKLNENVNLSGFVSMQPALSPNEDFIYFTSNRPGSYGKMDIWYSEFDENGNNLPPHNLGDRVNTDQDDVAPFYHATSQHLYFSSEGRKGFGGFDIYKVYGHKEQWTKIYNAGFLYNSSRDDIYFTLSLDGTKGFLSSDREGCKGDEGSCYKLFMFYYNPPKYTVSGYVYKENTKKIIPNALISVEDTYGSISSTLSDKDGFYEMPLHDNANYYFKCKKTSYFGDDGMISTNDVEKSKNFKQDFYLERIPIGEIEIPGILYDYDSADLRSESKLILDDLVNFLMLNDNIVIEIASHTDNRGNDNYNFKLSQERARAVYDYLVQKEIVDERLSSVGWGEKKLLIEDAQTDKEHQKNRRTTFKILSEDYIPKDDY